jgi:hypothetical protein
MTELTLEGLALRIEALERKLAELSGRSVVRPGTGDWDAAADAARQLREEGSYYFDVQREQDQYDMEHAEDHLP